MKVSNTCAGNKFNMIKLKFIDRYDTLSLSHIRKFAFELKANNYLLAKRRVSDCNWYFCLAYIKDAESNQ